MGDFKSGRMGGSLSAFGLKRFEALQERRLRSRGLHRLQQHDIFRKRDGQRERIAETGLRIRHRKAGQLGRLVVSGDLVCLLDDLGNARRQNRRKPEADVDGPLDSLLE